MTRKFLFLLFLTIPVIVSGQEKSLKLFLSDSCMTHSSVSLSIIDALTGDNVYNYFGEKSLTPASVMKLFTSAAALELLGPDYRFRTVIGYTGNLEKKSGTLNGNIVIIGGGDPALGSEYFSDHYKGFFGNWVNEIKNLGIKSVTGRVITDDSYYDYQPAPARWLWEDTGNYYGAGVFGLSVFDNTYKISLRSFGDSTMPVITRISPSEAEPVLTNNLLAAGTTDNGGVFSVPYNTGTWLQGSIPPHTEELILKASITDPPMVIARILTNKLDSVGIIIKGQPSTIRNENSRTVKNYVKITETISPSLSAIIEVLNHESVNLYAETLTKELGKVFKGRGSTSAGVETIYRFLADSAHITPDGLYMEDGCGLSPMDAVTSEKITQLLFFMKKNGKYFSDFFSSLPVAGKEGTLKFHFNDPVFENSMRAKSGSMTRVRSYAGFLKARSGKELIFSIIINNYSCTSQKLVSGIEEVLRETILQN